MKKSVLIVMNSLICGGAEKSLVSFLETIDYSRYDVDLLLFKQEGLFINKIPGEVNLLPEIEEYHYFDMSVKRAVKNSVRQGRAGLAIARMQAGFVFRSESNRARCEQRVWKFKSGALRKRNRHYDVAIGYLEMSPIYYVVDKVSAARKIGWIHTNYTDSGMDVRLDVPYFRKLDQVVTISDDCARSLKEHFPDFVDKITVIQNIVSPMLIRKLSDSEDPVEIDNGDHTRIVTVARLCQVKGIDMAIQSCRDLIDRGYRITWYVLGSGSADENRYYADMVKAMGLERHFRLLGVKTNPYAYVKKADLYVQPSRYEGKSIAIDEAKILGIPIVVTDFGTAKSQIESGVNGLITDMTPEGLADGIARLLTDAHLRDRIVQHLKSEMLGTESEINKIYALF